MTRIKKKSLIVLIFAAIFICSSCAYKKVTEKTQEKELPQYGGSVAIEFRSDTSNILNVKDSGLSIVESGKNVSDMSFQSTKQIFAYVENMSLGQNLVHNRIKILTPQKDIYINKFYSACNIKLSPGGSKLVYRSYKNDSIQSAEGMKVYDISGNKAIIMNSQVLVSGNLYEWLNDDEILYYGIAYGKGDSGKIYKYNFKTGKEETVVDKIDGYCMNFIIMKDYILFLEIEGSNSRLCMYNVENNQKDIISEDISNMWYAVFDNTHNDIYFIGSKKGELNSSLYKLDTNNHVIQRLTYDFPKEVNKDGGIGIDDKRNVYFCGNSGETDTNSNSIYYFNSNDTSVNLLSRHSGKYKIIKEVK